MSSTSLRLGALAAAVAASLAFAAPVLAQTGPGPQAQQGQGPAQRGPTEEQRKAFDEHRKAMRDVLTPEQREKMDRADTLRKEVMDSLTPDQKNKLQEQRKKMRESMRGQMGPGMHHGGPWGESWDGPMGPRGK